MIFVFLGGNRNIGKVLFETPATITKILAHLKYRKGILPADGYRCCQGILGYREFLTAGEKRRRDRKDIEILNRRADALNKEADEVLRHQVDL